MIRTPKYGTPNIGNSQTSPSWAFSDEGRMRKADVSTLKPQALRVSYVQTNPTPQIRRSPTSRKERNANVFWVAGLKE